MKKETPKSKSPRSPKTPATPPSRLSTESVLRNLQKLLEEKQFASIEDANAYLAKLTGPGLQEALFDLEDEPPDPRWQAQELAFDAMEAESAKQARELAQGALAIDPDCVDALVIIAGLDAKTEREAIAGLKKAVEAGERSLGREFFRENKGGFWGILETRPYMRARLQLAELLRAAGSGVQAMQHYEGMLELNPGDNQGVRYPLLGCYLAHGRLQEAAKLLRDYRGDVMASFAWGRVLERFLAGDRAGAKKALKSARAGNPFVELHLSGQGRLPDEMPDSYSLGSEEEAAICLEQIGAAWAKHKDAVFWILDQIYGAVAPGRRTRKVKPSGSKSTD